MKLDTRFRAWNVIVRKFEHFTLQDIQKQGYPIQWHILKVDMPTGLKDKNGVEVYEGDLIKLSIGCENVLRNLYQVTFRRGSFGLQDVRETKNTFYGWMSFPVQDKALSDNDYWQDMEDVMTVVGNIYQNADMIAEHISSLSQEDNHTTATASKK